MECPYCNNIFSSKTNLNTHQKTAKYCLKLQKANIPVHFTCENCDKTFIHKHMYQKHISICTSSDTIEENKLLKQENNYQKQTIVKLEQTIKELQDKLENVATTAVSRPTTTIDIEVDNEDINDEIEENQEYRLEPLDLGKGFSVQHREEDGYINVTDLCKAGGKKYNDWKRLEKSRAFIYALSTSAGISADLLIQSKNDGLNEERGTWVHPQVAINIAQWISPHFDVKVSAWVYEVMMTGKVDISNTKSYRQLQSENKDKELQIRMLTKKYLKKQPRQEITEKNVIYILTTKLLRRERRYILGKTSNLTNRLSTYNKTDEHEIVYYQECNSEDIMSTVENMIFLKLDNYREQANRERFILPPEQDISLFVHTVKECINFFHSIKDKNKELILEYGEQLKDRFGDEMDTIIKILDYKMAVDSGSEGSKTEFHHDFVKQMCSKTIKE